MVTERWWLSSRCQINGIFKGGGAKGLLYAGALAALNERRYWFRAVTGASAGAITATLVSSGLSPEAVTAKVPEALSQLRKNWLGDLIGQPFVVARKLGDWLEQVLREQVSRFGEDPGEFVTFQTLLSATSIELYIVAVDVARRQPVVSAPLPPQIFLYRLRF